MITADNITDEQIAELIEALYADGYDNHRDSIRLCRIATNPLAFAAERLGARNRVAEILTARRADVMPAMSCGCPIDAHSDTINVGIGPGTGITCGRGWPIRAHAAKEQLP